MRSSEGPWDIPPSWVWTCMGEIAEIVGGGTPRTSDPANWDPPTVAWITPADLSGYKAKTITHGKRFISEE
ncbi:MAG: restriction endonuclease subunit S, partial [Dactylosporangium sp.]|nr:restriction endonuclease subunit S [Dactylosporangium sp.]